MKKLSLLSIFLIFQLYASDFFIIDVRTPEEFSNGHVEESINYEWQEIALKIKDIDKNEKIYLYCRSGNRSQKATNILIDLGYKDVTNLRSLDEAAAFLDKKVTK